MEIHRRMLVVEDEPNLWRPLFEKAFPSPDWSLTFAPTAEHAIKDFTSAFSFDVIVVDFRLQGNSTGRSFLREIAPIDHNTCRLMFSGIVEGFAASEFADLRVSLPFIHKDKVYNDPLKLRNTILEAYFSHVAGLCEPNIQTEFGQLRAALVHTPSVELLCIDPEHPSRYLFEKPPSLSNAEPEHRKFLRHIREAAFRPLLLEIGLLLYDILAWSDLEQRLEITRSILLPNSLAQMAAQFKAHDLNWDSPVDRAIIEIAQCDPRRITLAALAGLNIADLLLDRSCTRNLSSEFSAQVVAPVSNLYFTRDTGFVLGKAAFLGRMCWPIRRRECAILGEIIARHPFMTRMKANLVALTGAMGEPLFVEGGDVAAIAEGQYVVAESQRTSRNGAQFLAKMLLDRGAVAVFQPNIPPTRAFSHLDTVCTIIGAKHVLAHVKAIESCWHTLRWTPDRRGADGDYLPEQLPKPLSKILREEFGMSLMETAGGGQTARQEQFDDALNVFVPDQNRCVVYHRNQSTNMVIEGAGFQTCQVSGSDLVMGRGGPRSMTLPLRRD